MHRSTFTRLLFVFVLLGSLLAALLNRQPFSASAQDEELFIQVYETGLDPNGYAYEINSGVDGRMYVSDNLAGEIRSYTGGGDSVRIFSSLGAVTDARPDADGMVWFVDQATNRLERLNPETLQVVYWELAGAEENNGFGTAIGSDGRIWISDFKDPLLFSYDPQTAQMCTYQTDLSGTAIGGSPYLVVADGSLWFSDLYGNAVLRLETEHDRLTRWRLPAAPGYWDFEAEGLALDGAGGLWFADSNTNTLGHLDLSAPEAPRFLRYNLPATYGLPVMLVKQGGLVWYNNQANPALGYLDPNSAAFSVHIPEVTTVDLTPDCSEVSPMAQFQATARTVTPVPWTQITQELLTPQAGWAVIPLDAEAYPWDLAYQQGTVWAVDNGRNMLLRIRVDATVKACKYGDQDGDLATTSDQAPLADWEMALRLDGAGGSTGLTGADGCKTWERLDIGQTASVLEELREGWEMLTPRECDLGLLTLPRLYTCDFINYQPALGVYLPLVRTRP